MKSTPNFSLPFVGTYQTYKKNTDDIARFLEETAVSIGYKSETPDTTVSPPNFPTKKKKKKGKKGKQQIPKKDEKDHRIRIPDFVRIATAIRHKPPPAVTIPGWFMRALDSTLKLRKRAAEMYRAVGSGTVEDEELKYSNNKHEYFITVLENVRELLAPLVKRKSNVGVTVSEVTVQDGNRYSGLDDEETEVVKSVEELTIDEPPIELELSELGKGWEDEGWETDDEESFEEFLAIFCLFTDLDTIRAHVSEVWRKYKNSCEDGVDLMTASIVTNTALDLVKRQEDDFLCEFPDLDNGPMICEIQFDRICKLKGVDAHAKEEPGDPYNFQMAETADWLYWGTAIALQKFYESLNDWKAGVAVARRNGKGQLRYDPTADRSTMNARQKWQEDKLILEDILPEFSQLAIPVIRLGNPKQLYLDELSEGIVTAIDEGCIPLYVVFGTQLFLDINHIFREKIEQAYEEFRTVAMIAKVSISISLRERRPSRFWEEKEVLGYQSFIRHVDRFYLGDPLMELKDELDEHQAKKKPGDLDEKFYLLKHHPLLCGSIAFAITLAMRKAGTKLANAWGTIIHTAHLYNVLRESNEVTAPWPDMDRVIAIHTEEGVFRGKRPRSKAACVERYAKIYNQRMNGPRLDWDKYHPVIQTLCERYYMHEDITWTVDKIEAIMQGGGRKGKKHQSRDGTSIVSLLDALQTIVSGEIPKLKFNYLSMHRRCLKFLFDLREMILTDLKEYHKRVYNADLKQDDQICTAAGWVIEFGGNVDAQKGARALKWQGGYRTEAFILAAKIMTATIEKEGSVEIKKIDKTA